jgi:uncharacterized protein (TIGR00255 family)
MKSMTGYGEASQNIRGGKLTVQIRSLNHRHLDLQLRVPREYLSIEEDIRKLIRDKISRGRIELFVNRYAAKAPSKRLELDEALIEQYLAGMKRLKAKYRLAGEIGVSLLSNVPDFYHVREVEVDGRAESRALLKAVAAALKKLNGAREREGKHLRADMEAQLEQLKEISRSLENRAGENALRPQKAPSWEPGGGAGAEKDALEAAGALARGDVNEEIVRLKTHIASLAQVIRERQPVGKKIDFILQEINRELNTISSKVSDVAMIQLVLQGKERVEKIREQTQNIE